MRPGGPAWRLRPRCSVPYLPLVLAVVTSAALPLLDRTAGPFPDYGGFAILVLVFGRQLLTMLDNDTPALPDWRQASNQEEHDCERAEQVSPADYGLTLPSEAEVIADLMKLVGGDVAILAWQEASNSDGDAGQRGNPAELLLRIADQLAARSDVAGVFGRSLAVRVNAYVALSTARTPE
jgi:hypothetical protein